MVWSSLLSSQNEGDGLFNPQYAFSRFIADCAIKSGFNVIRYPSVRIGSGDNYAFLVPEKINYLEKIKHISIFPE
jgi:hypothetical protein